MSLKTQYVMHRNTSIYTQICLYKYSMLFLYRCSEKTEISMIFFP